jgi:hypothetical protein
MAPSIPEFGRILKRLFRWASTLSLGFIAVMVVLLGFRIAEVHAAIADVHPLFGWAFLLALGLLLYLLIGRPLIRFLRMPVVMNPPKLPEPEARKPVHLVKHLAFVERYVAALPRNPAWEGEGVDVEAALSECRALAADAGTATEEDLPRLTKRLEKLEQGTVSRLLEPLDRKAADAIRSEALRVGLATAVSPYGTLDAFLVLWRNVNLVTRVATIYYGRPGTRGTLRVLRDVSMATMLGAYLQELGEIAGDMAGSLVGKTAGFMTGPLMEGCLNAVATLRIGYVAKGRCRAFNAWTSKSAPRIARAAIAEAAHFSAGLVKDVVTTVGGGVLSLTGQALRGLVDKVTGIFRKPRTGEEPAGA